MNVRYENQEDDADPMNGAVIATDAKLIELLNDRRNYPPFCARFAGDNGFELMIEIGGDVGCVQYSSSTGDPPYLMAVSHQPPMKSGDIEFMMGGTSTPIPARNIVSFDELKQILLYFLETGERSDLVDWESV